MLVDDILDSRFRLLTGPETGKQSYSGCYSGDLLSLVLKGARAGNLFITVIANMNTVAVAVLADLPCIIFCEGYQPTSEMIRKADEEKIALISTELNSVEVILDLSHRGRI